MTKEEAIRILKDSNPNNIIIRNYDKKIFDSREKAFDMAIKALQNESFTDIEQRIFLAAMTKEEKVCKEVCKDGEGVDLVAVCHRIERKVKRALWE